MEATSSVNDLYVGPSEPPHSHSRKAPARTLLPRSWWAFSRRISIVLVVLVAILLVALWGGHQKRPLAQGSAANTYLQADVTVTEHEPTYVNLNLKLYNRTQVPLRLRVTGPSGIVLQGDSHSWYCQSEFSARTVQIGKRASKTLSLHYPCALSFPMHLYIQRIEALGKNGQTVRIEPLSVEVVP